MNLDGIPLVSLWCLELPHDTLPSLTTNLKVFNFGGKFGRVKDIFWLEGHKANSFKIALMLAYILILWK